MVSDGVVFFYIYYIVVVQLLRGFFLSFFSWLIDGFRCCLVFGNSTVCGLGYYLSESDVVLTMMLMMTRAVCRREDLKQNQIITSIIKGFLSIFFFHSRRNQLFLNANKVPRCQ